MKDMTLAERQLAVVDAAADEPSTALAVVRPFELLPPETAYQQMRSMAKDLFESRLMPKTIANWQATFAVMCKGRELGIPAMAAVEGIAIISGKPACGAHLMLALVKRDYGPGAIRVAKSTTTECMVEWREQGWPGIQSYIYTIADAQTAGLAGGDTWRKYPAAMLRARCISAVVKMAFPEVVGGMMLPDELGADVTVTDAGEVVIVEPNNVVARPSRQPTERQEHALDVAYQHREEFKRQQAAGNVDEAIAAGAVAYIAQEVAETVDQETGEIIDAESRPSLNHLHGIAAERGLDHDALHVLAGGWFGVETMKDLTADHVADLELLVKRFTPEEWPVLVRMVFSVDATGFGVLMGFAVDLADAKTAKDLKDIFGRMTGAGVSEPALMAVGARRKDQLKRLSEMGP